MAHKTTSNMTNAMPTRSWRSRRVPSYFEDHWKPKSAETEHALKFIGGSLERSKFPPTCVLLFRKHLGPSRS
eukprot:1296301-Pyramimonas_sp.AAC.1